MRVVIADDSLLFREGVARVLAEEGFAVVGQAATRRNYTGASTVNCRTR